MIPVESSVIKVLQVVQIFKLDTEARINQAWWTEQIADQTISFDILGLNLLDDAFDGFSFGFTLA